MKCSTWCLILVETSNPTAPIQSGGTLTTAQPAPIDQTPEIPVDRLVRFEDALHAALRFHSERLEQTLDPDDIAVAAHRRSENAREEILAALVRMNDGTYGTCVDCGAPISLDRLEAVPQSAHCMDCARLQG